MINYIRKFGDFVSVLINSVRENSIADKKKLKSGDLLISINDNEINDVLDYDFYATESELTLVVERESKQAKIKLNKSEYEDIGLVFSTYLIDEQRNCQNKCIFCFIDQLPEGLRETLYFKDDDDRLSFLFGNYITLTNIKDSDIDRIIKMKISPINISVHTTNPELRVRIMKNKFAGDSLRHLYKLAQAGIKLNCQLVLMPEINDGDELISSLTDLAVLYPNVNSIACVPVGVTCHREGLAPLKEYTKEQATEVIGIIESFSNTMLKEHGKRLIYPSDEFFIKAQLPIPAYEYYDDFCQIENGVGMLAMLKYEFMQAFEHEGDSDMYRVTTLATGFDAFPFIFELVQILNQKFPNVVCNVIPIQNQFFGETISVAGLIVGQDLVNQLSGMDFGEELLLPSCMLRHEGDMFLDNMTLDELQSQLGVTVRLCSNDGADLLDAMLGNEW